MAQKIKQEKSKLDFLKFIIYSIIQICKIDEEDKYFNDALKRERDGESLLRMS
jgi:hypothetical protein